MYKSNQPMFAEDVFIELLDEWNTSGKVDRDVQKLIRSLGKINNGVDPETFFINQLGKHWLITFIHFLKSFCFLTIYTTLIISAKILVLKIIN